MTTLLCGVKFLSQNFSAVNEDNHVSSDKDSRPKEYIQTEEVSTNSRSFARPDNTQTGTPDTHKIEGI
jgi:hypothetical protein